MFTSRGTPPVERWIARTRREREYRIAAVTRDVQAVRQIVRQFLARQRAQVMLKGDALAQLPHRLVGELLIEFGLAKQDHLREFSFFRFQIGQQPQRFKRLQRHRLGFVEENHHALALARAKSSSAWFSALCSRC